MNSINHIQGRKYTLLIFMVLMIFAASAQTTAKPKTINPPYWVKAMNDPEANYYKAVKSYEEFWKGKEKPEDEEHLMSKNAEVVKDHIKKRSKKEMKEQRILDYYRYQCKRFENWTMINKPYVQTDGHILTADERLKLWEQTQKSK